MWGGARGVGDHEGVAGVGLGVARVEIGDTAHGQAGQVGDLVPTSTSDRDRQRADCGGLIDYVQQRTVGGEPTEQRLQFRFAVGQRPVVQPLAGQAQAHGVVLALPHVQTNRPRNTPYVLVIHQVLHVGIVGHQ